MRCCVVDDEPLAARLIASYIEKTPFMELVGTYSSAHEAIKPIMEECIDVAFLDIRMSQLDGIEFARLLPKDMQLVFVTAYSEYALQAFKLGAADYLLKPVSFEDFSATAKRLYDRYALLHSAGSALGPATNGQLLVKLNHGMEQIDTDRIVIVEGLKDYVKIHTDDRPMPIVTLSSMRAIESYLPPQNFLRVHRSFIINTRRITRIDRQKVTLTTREIPIGESYRSRVNSYISSHLPGD